VKGNKMRLPGEYEAVLATIETAETYGYGNLIAWLRWKWARKLMENNISMETAIEATGVEPYPPDVDMLKGHFQRIIDETNLKTGVDSLKRKVDGEDWTEEEDN
jgi:hypothetical protein